MKLFEPLTIQGMAVRNRVLMSPMEVGVGLRSPRARGYYAERARGGVGLITVAAVSVDVFISDEAWRRPGGAAAFVEGIRPLIEAVHQAGARIGPQLWHGNRFPAGTGEGDSRGQLVAPSARGDMRELSVGEIQEIISRFARAAAKAREIGFDFVGVHGAHGYLPCRFFSPADNRRRDDYGGSLEGRMRFGRECVAAIRKAVGPDYPIFFRLGAWEDREGGITLEDSARFAAELERAGADVIDVSVGNAEEPGALAIPGPDRPQGTFVYLAEAIKRRVGVPVVAVGRIKEPQAAEAILERGQADLVAIGRQLIADPFWPQKVALGQWDDIIPCISCNACLDGRYLGTGLKCTVNPAAARELEFPIDRAERVRRVMVIGGGPAGMEAARVAALRGHQVSLYEKGDRLGGQLLVASVAPFKEELETLTAYLSRQLEKAGVSIRLGQEVTPEMVAEEGPEVVVVATGATPITPDVPGVARGNVVTALEVLSQGEAVGARVVIIGGGMVGCETAEFLAQEGRKVTVLEMLEEIGADIGPSIRRAVLHRLGKAGVEMVTGAKAEAVTERGVRAVKEGRPIFFEGDTVVLAVGMTANSRLANELRGQVANLQVIGDCLEARRLPQAMEEGLRAGREV